MSIIVGDFNTILSEMDRSIRQEVRKDIVELYNTISQLHIVDMCRLLHPAIAEYRFSSGLHGKFTHVNIGPQLGHKSQLI